MAGSCGRGDIQSVKNQIKNMVSNITFQPAVFELNLAWRFIWGTPRSRDGLLLRIHNDVRERGSVIGYFFSPSFI